MIYGLFAAAMNATFAAATAADAPARLIGWWVNPSPGNVSLLDGKTEIELARQGAEQVEGPWPKFPDARWVRSSNGHYGYGCASLSVSWDGEKVSRIVKAKSLPLAACRKIDTLRSAERKVR